MSRMINPHQAASLMEGFNRPWWFAGGWALELFVGRPLREHEDIEIAIWRDDQMALRKHFIGWNWETAISVDGGGQWIGWNAQQRVELPNFQLKADCARENPRELEFMLNDAKDGQLQFRREPSITVPADAIVGRSSDGLPFLVPQVQLLYKAKHHRPKDETDFAAAFEVLSKQQRDWLKSALQRWNPNDPWIARL